MDMPTAEGILSLYFLVGLVLACFSFLYSKKYLNRKTPATIFHLTTNRPLSKKAAGLSGLLS